MRGPGGPTPLVEIAGEEFTGQAAEVLRLLVERGADVNAQADDGKTALHWAAQNHDLAEMEYLLNQKADPHLRIHDSVYYTSNGFTPLHFQLGAYASLTTSPSAADRIKGIELLLKHGADINAKDANGNTPLHLAAEWGDPEIVSALLARGADARAVNLAGQTPLALIQSLQDTPPIRRLRALLSAAQAHHSE
jgi:ankyrin repeat protein